jgi:uncharacterized protein YndB with AHSA1/START domain
VYDQRATGLVRGSRPDVYAALLDPAAVSRWRVPDDMTARVLEWEATEGGRFRVSLTYRDPGRAGKTDGATDTYAGRFVRLVPGVQVVEEIVFESDDAGLAGTMRMTWTLQDRDGGTEVDLLHQGLPEGVRPEDNEAGTRMALANLAAYVEAAG